MVARTSRWHCPVCGLSFVTTDRLKKDEKGRTVCPECGSARYFPVRDEARHVEVPELKATAAPKKICEMCGEVLESVPYATVFAKPSAYKAIHFCSSKCITDFYRQEEEKRDSTTSISTSKGE